MRPSLYALSFVLASPALAACTSSIDSPDQGPAAPAPTSLRQVAIDPNFTFASTRGVTIHVQVDPKLVPAGAQFPLEIRSTQGHLLVQAALGKGGVFTTAFPLPTSERELLVTIGDQEQLVTVGDDNLVKATFE